jgi:hypothetical protein
MKYDGGDDFGQDWEELCRDQICDFQNYVSVDRDVATSAVLTVAELCEAYVSTRSVEEKNKAQNEEDMVPSFAETYEALQKFWAFFYAHSVTDADRERILGLENSYFQLRNNCAIKQKTMYDYFVKKKVVFFIFRCRTFFICFLRSLQKRKIESSLYPLNL